MTDKPFAKYWVHNGLIKVNNQKMSKSLGNSLLMKDLRKDFHVESIKFALLQNSYHSDLNIVDGLFDEAEKHLTNFYKVLNDAILKFGKLRGRDKSVEENFDNAMRDDINTAKAISYLFSIFKDAKEKIANGDESVLGTLNSVTNTYNLIGLFKANPSEFLAYVESKNKTDIPEKVTDLAQQRWQAKKDKNFALADEIRAKITDLGYVVKDTREGFEISKI